VYIRAELPKDKSGQPGWQKGSAVEFDITLPAAVIGATEDVLVHCSGRVMRVEKLKQGMPGREGVACVIDKYDFVRKR
jgi:hypothetical protein